MTAPESRENGHAARDIGPLPSRERVDGIVHAERFEPRVLIDELKDNFVLRQAFAADAGVWEKYTIEEHTCMVMGQFEKYYGKDTLPAGTDTGFFRLLLALHDIGKPDAIREGDKDRQHEHTVRMARQVLEKLGYAETQLKLAESLLAADPIGRYLKTRRDAPKVAAAIAGMAENAGVPPREFFELLVTLFKVDAGAYTVDAGGKRSLDELFDFDPDHRFIDFSDTTVDLMDALEEEIANLPERRDEGGR